MLRSNPSHIASRIFWQPELEFDLRSMREAIKQVETGSTMTRHQHVVVRLCKALGRLGAGLNQSWRSQTQFFIGAVYTVIMLELRLSTQCAMKHPGSLRESRHLCELVVHAGLRGLQSLKMQWDSGRPKFCTFLERVRGPGPG